MKQIYRLKYLVLLLLLGVGVQARGLVKDTDGFYIIGTPDDYRELMTTPELWTNGNNFKQILDIDFEGATLIPIGHTASGTKPFAGKYDGQGHTISNAKIYWTDVDSNHKNFGLFGVLGGTSATRMAQVYNLTIKDVVITRASAKKLPTDSDVKIGILAGVTTTFSAVHDISIVDCRINDGGFESVPKAIMVGGLTGDVASGDGGTSNMTNQNFKLNNVSCDVDIDLSQVTKITPTSSSSWDPQMFAGGIVGRIRSAQEENYIPKNGIFTGTINFPRGSSSPSVANMRHSAGNTNAGLVETYAGEYKLNGVLEHASANDKFHKRNFYYNYRAYNANSGALEEVTATNPAETGMYGTRTFLLNKMGDGTAVTPKLPTEPTHWAYAQGVNFGTHIDPVGNTETRDNLIASLNGGITTSDRDKYRWEWSEDTNSPHLLSKEDWHENFTISIENASDPKKYEVAMVYKSTPYLYPYVNDEESTFQWYTATTLVGDEWTLLAGADGKELTYDPNLYYKVSMTLPDGYTYTSEYRAPSVTVYVYDKEATDWYKSNFAGDGVPEFTESFYDTDGDDANDGFTPQTPVKTIEKAYEKLGLYGNERTNKIVVMGFLEVFDFLSSQEVPTIYSAYAKPTTITGSDNHSVDNGILSFNRRDNGDDYRFLQAPLRFDRIQLMRSPKRTMVYDSNNRLSGNNKASGSISSFFFVCRFFDFTIDENVYMVNFADMKENMGLPGNITTIPHITIVGGYNDYNETEKAPYPHELFPDHPNFYSERGRGNITLRSGAYGRVICASRNDGLRGNSKNMASYYDKPNCTKVTINIPNDINLSSEGEYREFTKYGLALAYDSKNKKLHYKTNAYTHNVGLIAGGQTDGTVYNDVELNLYAGYFGRVITGNISYGRAISVGGKNYPPDSFYGRTVVNLHGKSKIVGSYDDEGNLSKYEIISETTINELYGGILGRFDLPQNKVTDKESAPFFYGESVINMYGAHIGKYTGSCTYKDHSDKQHTALERLQNVESSLYGAGSGGVAGLGNDVNHTCDKLIPYLTPGATNVTYGSYQDMKNAGGKMPVMRMFDGKEIDLAQTKCYVNIYSGILDGNVYGGGLGYSNNVPEGDFEVTSEKAAKYDSKYITEKGGKKYVPGYIVTPGFSDGYCQAGFLYGDAYVNMLETTEYEPATVLGNIYGGGAGDARYADAWQADHPLEESRPMPNPFRAVGTVFGNVYVNLEAGSVGNRYNSDGGEVYGGCKGIPGYDDIAALYGSTDLTINGAIVYGHIFAGSETANIHKRRIDLEDSDKVEPGTGNTRVTVKSGTIGDCIFGGSRGSLESMGQQETKAIIEGDAYTTIEGGDFIWSPYVNLNQQVTYDADGNPSINIQSHPELYRTFNIYGGGAYNCDIFGNANVRITSSLLKYDESFPDPRENPNALEWHDVSWFQAAYMDLTYRRFSVYGGGYGEKTNVLNTNVYVTIPKDRPGVTLPHGFTLSRFLDHQSFFDIAGGGYNGNVGHWNEEGDFSKYIGGDCRVTIDDYTYARKIIGGGFYGSCSSTETYVRCGSLRQVYGGSLLGYVHDKAFLQFGNRVSDFVQMVPDASAPDGKRYELCELNNDIADYEGKFDGDIEELQKNYPELWAEAARRAKSYNDYIFITEEIYGGNDVKGIIGTRIMKDSEGNTLYDQTDGAPLFQADVESTEERGVVFQIYGGTFMGNVYGAGNGHYRGYYVPDWTRYNDGPARMYSTVRSTIPYYDRDGNITNALRDENGNIVTDSKGREIYTGKVYRTRPMVGCVNFDIRGNSEVDYVKIKKNLFGGGRNCTIGQWNTYLPIEDPRRLIKGGHLHVNMGGHIKIDGNFYAGAEGAMYGEEHTIPDVPERAQVVAGTYDGSTTNALAAIGDIAYGHWWYNFDENRYEPGFPPPGQVDGNLGLTGEHQFRGYMKNIEMEGDVEVTFFRYLYERDNNGEYVYLTDDHGNYIIDSNGRKMRKRKHWVPAEIALATEDLDPFNDQYRYKVEDISINSMYLGGYCGSMTNNNVMTYCFAHHEAFDESSSSWDEPGHDRESWGSVYRLCVPQGVTLHEKLVLGSENANNRYYAYNDDFSGLVKTKTVTEEEKEKEVDATMYLYEGGMVTQSPMTFDCIVYNDVNGLEAPVRSVPDDFYTDTTGKYLVDGVHHIKDLAEWTVLNGTRAGTKIYRFGYEYKRNERWFVTGGGREEYWDDDDWTKRGGIFAPNYGLAVTKDDKGNVSGFIGTREARAVSGVKSPDPLTQDRKTIVKCSASCKFELITTDENGVEVTDHEKHYGGNIYGGCYNSGIIIGDVVMNLGTNLLGEHFDKSDYDHVAEYSMMRHNIGRVFGGGFGKETRTEGDVFINLIHNFKGMNVFGGGMEGNVYGTSHIRYVGDETNSFIYGSIYGGGLMGSVGRPGLTEIATYLRLYSGNVNQVYGGSCMGDVYGRTFIELCDEVTTELSHLNYQRMIGSGHFEEWSKSRLIAGNVYGGNNIAGNIFLYEGEPNSGVIEPASEEITRFGAGYNTSILIHEHQHIENPSGGAGNGSGKGLRKALDKEGGKDTPGSENGYNGFPLVGELYGGSNGNYGVHGEDNKYAEGEVIIATGIKSGTRVINLAGNGKEYAAYDVPNVGRAVLNLHGGTIINAYGGGNKSTITDAVVLDLDYPIDAINAKAGFRDPEEFDKMWTVLHLTSDEQQTEVTESAGIGEIFRHHIFRLFGGNNNADMAIQPTWNLKKGRIGSLFSGGNLGRMTYYKPAQGATPAEGLTLTVNDDNLYVDYLYGGGRIGDIYPIDPATGELVTAEEAGESFYGATLNVLRGNINHVYGGNDVVGYVNHGTHVNIEGAISGDVYCAGNGNYLYQYDRTGSLFDYADTQKLGVAEKYEYQTDEYQGARYFALPAKADYGFDRENPTAYNASPSLSVMAINSYRPNVERSKLTIAGRADNDKVWIRGSVYCGGNSSTVVPKDEDADNYDVKLEIGNHVVINSVFMGSNGAEMTTGTAIQYLEKLNSLEGEGGEFLVEGDNDLSASQIPAKEAKAAVKTQYPAVLDLFMRAVEIVHAPRDFRFDPDIHDAYIGEFVVGGNRGSMLTGKKIDLTFPENLVIYGYIVGGCKDANVTYGHAKHIGGLISPLDENEGDVKVDLKIKSAFKPLAMMYMEDELPPTAALTNMMVDKNGNSIMVEDTSSTPENPVYVVDSSVPATERYYHDRQCNIYGGCFTSGKTVGGVNVDLYSDMLYYDMDEGNCIDKQAVANGWEHTNGWRSFSVVGGGYGADTEVWGDIRVRMLPMVSGTEGRLVVHNPSAATIFGGSEEGLVVGNTTVEIRSGKVLGNVYGASEAARMYGSTQVIVGYPKYYRAAKSGVYRLDRVDKITETSRNNLRASTGHFAVNKSVAYRKGDIVPANVVDMIDGKVDPAYARTAGFELGQSIPDNKITPITAENVDVYFTKEDLGPNSFGDGLKWDDIVIWIGDQKSNEDPSAPYYGQGNVYGGGYIPNSSKQDLTGEYTVRRYNKTYHPAADDADYLNDLAVNGENGGLAKGGYGGNTAVMIWDNKENAQSASVDENGKPVLVDGKMQYIAECKDGSAIKDHVFVGTSRFVEETNPVQAMMMGLTLFAKDGDKYLTYRKNVTDMQEELKNNADKKFYSKSADGGVYGGGRKVFAEGFRAIDVAYYGYADHSPQSPKLLNTIQRADVAFITDCCIELVGASDFAVDETENESLVESQHVGGDNTLYAINRIGSLHMRSSISPEANLDEGDIGERPESLFVHDKKRSRNYIALYRNVNHLGALASNWEFDMKYHKEDAKVTEEATAEETVDHQYGANGISSYATHKHEIIALHKLFRDYDQEDDDTRKAAALNDFTKAYDAYRTNHVDENLPETTDASEMSTAVLELFNRRNVGSSANMIGMNSGYALKIESMNKNGMYFGPAFGVTEIKLITVAVGDGGGYVYALNNHYDPENNFDCPHDRDKWCDDYGHDFLMTTGNFVFPGAAYYMTDEHNNKTYNYIIDDCYPIGHGFYEYQADYYRQHPAAPSAKPRREGESGSSVTPLDFNVNNEMPVHYWYINGQRYTWNLTVTGITSDSEQDFYLNNGSELVSFPNVVPGTGLRVKKVTWLDNNPEGDIIDLEKAYDLYFTLGKNTRNPATVSEGGNYVAHISRETYDGSGNAFDTSAYHNISDEEANQPHLGIHLKDKQKNRLEDQPVEVGRAYYEDHLKTPHYVQVVMEADNGGGTPVFEYVINLTIDYLLGPLLKGDVVIENCALPGEYIYANAYGITVDMDETNLATTSPYWRLYPTDANGNRIDENGKTREEVESAGEEFVPVYEDLCSDENKPIYCKDNDDLLVHLPAYWYQNGWELAYGITAGGVQFERTAPDRLEIHNYHRMKPRYNVDGKPIDQRLVAGARVYIEDDEDEAYFFDYLAEHQADDCDMESPDGKKIGPRYAEGINFYQNVRTTLPTNAHIGEEIIFKGNYHGNGHRVIIPEQVRMNFKNEGYFYNTGFYSEVNDDNTKVFAENTGSLINCFYFNKYEKGSFLGSTPKSHLAPGHNIFNCYQNTLSNEKLGGELGYKYNEMMHLSSAGFRYGHVAYNLNAFYLQKRHKLLHYGNKDANKPAAEKVKNNAYSLSMADRMVRKWSNDTEYQVPYIEEMFNNGDYRYAMFRIPEDFTHFTEALRTADNPNYLDNLNERANNRQVSKHDYTHKVDEARWCDIHQLYHPNFDVDYLFFGEDLRSDINDAGYDELPAAYTPDTRVYRVGGFYGTASDKGYFLNQKGYVDSPRITAVDFVGYRDRNLYDTNGLLKDEIEATVQENGWLIKNTGNPDQWQEIFMPPTLDVPWTWDDENGANPRHDFRGFDVSSDYVTHNLLIYTEEWPGAMEEMAKFHYTDLADAANLGNDEHSFAEHNEASVRAHHIIDDGTGPRVYGNYFHLVDNHDFNAPVAFRAQQAWYTREPQDYADEYRDGEGYLYKTAWEGICLPFTVGKTYAFSTNTFVQKDDMGEITHFFGENDWKGHEYWLRRLSGVDDDKLIFERPRSSNAAGGEDVVADYNFENDILYRLYKEHGYDETGVADHHHDVLYHGEAADGKFNRTISDYMHLSGGVPYVVAFPGERYYEFDLSGKFFAKKNPQIDPEDAVKQGICYFAKHNNVAGEYVTIPVTDAHPINQYTQGGYTFTGTFSHITNNEEKAKGTAYKYVPNLHVLDAYDVASGKEIHNGEVFRKVKNETDVMPFRVYVTKDDAKGKAMRIASNEKVEIKVVPEPVEDPEAAPADEEETYEGIEVWVDKGALMVRTPYDVEGDLVNFAGQRMLHVKAFRGTNRYTGIDPGFYIIFRHKIKI